jgi:tocopherol cyclase
VTFVKNRFEGLYFKHQKNGRTLAFISGVSESGAFIQVITDNFSKNYTFPSGVMQPEVRIGNCKFSRHCAHIDLPDIKGDLSYSGITPIHSDVMGPFRFFPMECRHTILSMRHRIHGSVTIQGQLYDFEDGIGYMEGDSGRSFPKKYVWLQANDFEGGSFMLSVAEIPFCRFHFEGCICVVIIGQKEYRLATYSGAKVRFLNNTIIVTQRKLRLTVKILSCRDSFSLVSPKDGKMQGLVKEHNHTSAEITLTERDSVLCSWHSNNAGLEICGYSFLSGQKY